MMCGARGLGVLTKPETRDLGDPAHPASLW